MFVTYGLSWADFVRCGADCEQLLALGDPLVTEVVTRYRKASWEGKKDKPSVIVGRGDSI
ncbi:hypothetical protein C942_00922 [Photobacterium marinum]|uniref:Uncharacterized protein n=1 Tax=Photobacterium marinum TaxID=1056511 RepID=L8JAE6_9GAMM|nr:hypothetical protein C942_00922 [Photobacterium marinum]